MKSSADARAESTKFPSALIDESEQVLLGYEGCYRAQPKPPLLPSFTLQRINKKKTRRRHRRDLQV